MTAAQTDDGGLEEPVGGEMPVTRCFRGQCEHIAKGTVNQLCFGNSQKAPGRGAKWRLIRLCSCPNSETV
jgi:hypothetical protein